MPPTHPPTHPPHTWQVILSGYGGDHPPTDEEGFLAFAASLPAPSLAAAMAVGEPLSPIMRYQGTQNVRRLWEEVALPEGLGVMGDAGRCHPACSAGRPPASVSCTWPCLLNDLTLTLTPSPPPVPLAVTALNPVFGQVRELQTCIAAACVATAPACSHQRPCTALLAGDGRGGHGVRGTGRGAAAAAGRQGQWHGRGTARLSRGELWLILYMFNNLRHRLAGRQPCAMPAATGGAALLPLARAAATLQEFQQAIAATVEQPWTMAITEDLSFPTTGTR